MSSGGNTSCVASEPCAHIDACTGNAAVWTDRCKPPDIACKQRAQLLKLQPAAVLAAAAFDNAQKAKDDPNGKCRRKPKCVKRPMKEPMAPQQTEKAPSSEEKAEKQTQCESTTRKGGARARRYNLLGQPVSWDSWQRPASEGPIDNNDKNYNVIGQRIIHLVDPKTLDLPYIGHQQDTYNVIGQTLTGYQWCPDDEEHDYKFYNLIGQPVLPPDPPPPTIERPKGASCLKTSYGM